MKKILLLVVASGCLYANAQVGIGTADPQTGFHVADSAVAFTKAGDIEASSSAPISGAGRRLMWYPEKAAFRVGYVGDYGGAFWDAGNVGNYSFAAGSNTRACGSNHGHRDHGNRRRIERIASCLLAGGEERNHHRIDTSRWQLCL